MESFYFFFSCSTLDFILFRMKFSSLALNYYFYSEYVVESSMYKSLLDDEAKIHRHRSYPRVAVKHFLFSSFRHLYLSCNDQALLNATGYGHATYALLVRKF